MNLGINLGYFTKIEESDNLDKILEYARLCTKAGLRKLDFLSSLEVADSIDFAKKIRDAFEKENIEIHQSHAPFYRYKYKKGATLEDYKDKLYLSLEVASTLGAKHLVVHADEYVIPQGGTYDSKAAENFTYDLIAPLVDRAEKRGVKIAIENLFEDRLYKEHPYSRFTSDIDELLSIIERFEGRVGCCWDFGHANVAFGENSFENFKKIFPYLTCTHVHDNYYGVDMHVLPTLGGTDFAPYVRYMKEVGYKGEFVYELVYGAIPKCLTEDFLNYIKKVGDYILSY